MQNQMKLHKIRAINIIEIQQNFFSKLEFIVLKSPSSKNPYKIARQNPMKINSNKKGLIFFTCQFPS